MSPSKNKFYISSTGITGRILNISTEHVNSTFSLSLQLIYVSVSQEHIDRFNGFHLQCKTFLWRRLTYLVSYSVLEQDILSIGLEGWGIPDPNSTANSILDFLKHQPSWGAIKPYSNRNVQYIQHPNFMSVSYTVFTDQYVKYIHRWMQVQVQSTSMKALV